MCTQWSDESIARRDQQHKRSRAKATALNDMTISHANAPTDWSSMADVISEIGTEPQVNSVYGASVESFDLEAAIEAEVQADPDSMFMAEDHSYFERNWLHRGGCGTCS